MSANQASLGPSAEKSRPTRSSAPSSRRTLFSEPSGDLARRLEAPAQPRSAMILATRFSEVTTPSRLSRANTLGEPYVRRLASKTLRISTASSASRSAWALAGLRRHW